MAHSKLLAALRGALPATITVALCNVAAADPVPSLELRGFNPPSDPSSGLYFEPASAPDTLDWNGSLWLSYAYRPVTLRNPADEDDVFAVIEHQLKGRGIDHRGHLKVAGVEAIAQHHDVTG